MRLRDHLRGGVFMATNVQVDDRLAARAVVLGQHRTKKAAVTQALTEYIQRLEQENILSVFGTIEYSRGHNYKRQRARS